MAFSPRAGGAVISFTVEGAQTAQRQIETISVSMEQLSDLATSAGKKLAGWYAGLKIADYAKDSVLLAARYETLAVVMHTAGVNAGYSNAQMNAYAAGLEKSGISMVKAREALVAMTTANLDNNKSLELGRMAQDLAVVANKSSSETLTDLIMNIQQADTEGLKHMGIILNQDEALQKYASSHGTVTKALTQTQKAEAIQAAVMLQGAKYAGIYEKAMGTAGKALNSLGRYIENIRVRLGTPFLEGFAQGVFGVTDGVKQLNKWLDELEKNGAMELLAKSIGASVGGAIGLIKDVAAAIGDMGSVLISVGRTAWEFFDKYLGGMTTIKAATIAFALLLSGFMVEQAVIGFNALSAAAWGAVLKVSAAFLAMSRPVVTFFTVLKGAAAAFGWGTALAIGARTLVAGVGAAIASIPGVVGAAVVAAGLGVGYIFAKAFGDQLDKFMPQFINDAVNKGMAWVVSKTSSLPEISEAVPRDKPEDVAKAAANKAEKEKKEQLMRDMNNAVVAAEGQIAITASANTRLKALNEARDQQLKQSLDQRIITQADYLQKKEKMDVAEAQGQLAQIAAQKAQLSTYMAAFKAGAPLGQGRDPAADANEMIKLSGEEAAAQTKLNAVKQSYAYEIAGAVIESYTKEFGSIASIVDAQEQLVRTTRQNFLEAGKTAEQRETLSALRMQSAADELSAELEAKQANGTATKEYIQNTSAMITALSQMGQARLKALGSDVAVSFINDAKAMRDDTVALYADMANTFLGTEEERVRAAAAASIRLAAIRKQDADSAIDKTNDTDMQKIAAKQKVLQAYNDYVDSVNQNADAKAFQASDGFRALADTLADAFDPMRVEHFGQTLAGAFGTAGDALGGLLDTFDQFDKQQRASDRARLAAAEEYKNKPAELAAANAAINAKQTKDTLGYYANMASAAKGFFKENTAGYKVMEGAERAFRVIELANQMESLYTHLFVTTSKAAATTTGQAVETGAVVAGEAARNAAKVPGVFMAFMSALGPWGMAAAGVAIAAVLGSAFSGGRGGGVNPNSAEERQKVQGTGTVLGDPSGKTESIAHSLEIMQKNSDLELDYQNSMLDALQNIATALGGAAKGISQTTGITGGSAFGTVAASNTSLIGASHTKDITDSGVQFSGTFGQLRSGGGTGRQYEDVYTTSDGGLFRSGWSRTDTNYKALTAEAMKPFALIFDNMGNLLVDAGTKLGRDSTSLNSAINSIGVNFEVSLRGLSGQDLTDALNAGISVAFDKVTTELFPTIAQFQQMGEGLGETLVRVASDVQGVNSIFGSMNKSLAGMSIEAKEQLVEAAGGLDKFASSAKSFMQNFYSEDEQRAATKAKLNPVLAQYGLTTEGAAAQKMFRDFVTGLNVTTAAGAQTYATLMDLQQAFFDVTDAAASQRADLQDQLDQLTMTSAELLAKQRDALDESNRALFDQVQAAQKAKDAQDAAKSSLGDFISRMKSFSETTASINSSLVLSDLTTLTPEQQYAEARRQFEQTRQAAAGGDATAQGNLQSIEQTFLQLSKKIYGGDAQYSSDLATVMRTNDELSKWAAGSVDVAQASLDALNNSSASLTDISGTLKLIAQGVQYLPVALAGQEAPTFTPSYAPIDYSRMGTLDMAPLVTEVKALREEVKALREDAQKQSDAEINAGAAATNQAADKIVAGQRAAATNAAWAAKNSTREPT